jgi:dihydroorotate dehydrogenase (NAD+) catalytic subunit
LNSGRSAATADSLRLTVCSIEFQNPVLLASGTAAYGREVADVTDLEALGGIVTKAVSLEERGGAEAPRVTEFAGGMLNAVGLANPGVEKVRSEHLPWLAASLRKCKVVVNVVGSEAGHFPQVVGRLEDVDCVAAFELNLSCPNVRAGGLEFGADIAVMSALIASVKRATRRPVFVKLSPTVVDIGRTARAAQDAGADAITVVNTLPGMLIDVRTRRPRLGFGSGGISGAALLPVGVLATRRVATAVSVPVLGVGGIATAADALQYFMAGASLVAIGTASFRDPRTAERVVAGLAEWCEREGVASLSSIVGTLDWKPQ